MDKFTSKFRIKIFFGLAFALSFLSHQITTLKAQSSHSSKTKQSKNKRPKLPSKSQPPKAENNILPVKKPNYDRQPFNLELETIPTNYEGNDPGYVSTKVYISDAYSPSKKSEFETTSEYQNRIDKALSEKVYSFEDNSITLKSLLAFKVQGFLSLYLDMAYDADKGLMEMAALPSEYEGDDNIERKLYYENTFTLKQGTVIDKQVPYFTQNKREIMVRSVKYPLYKLTALNIKDFSLEYFAKYRERSKSSYIPNITGKKAIVARVKMSADEAKELKGDEFSLYNPLEILLIGQLVSPYLTHFDSKENPSLVKPVSVEKNFYYLNFHLKEIWFYNKKNGKIYSKIKASKQTVE